MDLKAVKDFFLRNFLIIGLITVLSVGLVDPEPGIRLAAVRVFGANISQIAIMTIFLVSGLCLDSVREDFSAKVLGLGIVLILFVTPLMAIPIMGTMKLDPTLDRRLLQGMALFCAVPTTLSSGVTMITNANGNVSMAILLTAVTNILGVFTLSITAPLIFTVQLAISPWEVLRELVVQILIPLLVGMLLRLRSSTLSGFAKENKKQLGLIQNSGILLVVLLNISIAQDDIIVTSHKDLGLCIVLGIAVHVVYRALSYVVAEAAALPPADWVTIVLMCSQKSLPVSISVLAALPAQLQKGTGVSTIPCICAHAAQLLIDSVLAVRWEVRDKAAATAAESTPLWKP